MPKKSARKKSNSLYLIDPETLRQKIKLKNLQTKLQFTQRHKKSLEKLIARGVDLAKIREHSGKIIAAGALAGTLAMSGPVNEDHARLLPPPPHEILAKDHDLGIIPAETPAVRLRNALGTILPEKTRPLTVQEEKYLEQIIKETTGMNTKATLEGEHLNTTYGKIGAEQHLRRYPGDTNANHAPKPGEYGGDDPEEILKEGTAPGLGAWGYFARSNETLTPDLVETERWYAVVQTLYLPDWNTRQPYLKDWYKYRKIMIINTDNGKAVVASIADSGPAAFTGKHYGGSPEVMDYLGGPRYKKGPVLVFFVDDPNNEVPLGPVEYNKI